MQTTLLGLAIAVILALVTALVGPLFVDWGRYRSNFEAEASRLVGQQVRVTGAIDVRLLPTPSLIVSGVEIGKAGEKGDKAGEERMLRVRALGIEFGLGALLRGELRAVQMQIAAPELTLGLDNSGKVALPAASSGFNLDALAIDKLIVEDGRLILADAASKSRLVLDKLWFNGEVRSLAGPFKGEGAFLAGGGLYGYRINTSRLDESGLKLKISLDPSDRPLAIETEGVLAFERGAPRFEGILSLARPVGTAMADGRTLVSEPWRATSRIKASAAQALFEQVEFQYGPEERAMKLTGTAEFKFGSRPRIESVLSGRQFDLDRLVATPDVPKRLPYAVMRTVAEKFGGGLHLAVPTRIGIGIDTLTIGGAVVQNLRGDIKAEGDSWSLEGVEFRAPGLTQVQLSGRLDVGTAGVDFTGPADIASADPRALFSWLEGRGDAPSGLPRPMRARGDIAFGSGKVAVDRLKAEIDRKAIEGRLAYLWAKDGRPARLEAEVNAAELDIDGLIGFGKAALAGTTLDRPGEVALALAIGRATILGVEARNANAKLKFDANGLQIERFSVADLGGTALNASGRIDTSASWPRGSITLDVAARDLSGATALAGRFMPQSDQVRRFVEQLAPARLRATLEVDGGAGSRTNAKLALEGNAGTMRVNLTANANGDPTTFTVGEVRLDGRLAADDGALLLAMLGLDRPIAAEKRPQQLSFLASGPLNGDIRVEARLAGELDAAANGTLRIAAENGMSGALNVSVTKADLRRLRPATAGKPADPLPATLTTRVALNGNAVTLADIVATLGGAPLRGRLGFDLAATPRVDGRIETETIDAAAVLMAALGMPAQAPNAAWVADPFLQGWLPNLEGKIEFKAARAVVTPTLAVKDFRAALGFGRQEIRIEDMQGEYGGGRLAGQLAFRRGPDGLGARGRVALNGADAAAVLPSDGRTITGRLSLQVEAEGTGLSPKTLLGSLAGNGVVTLEGAQIAGLDPKTFPAIMRAVDQGLALDVNRIRGAVSTALDAGRLTLPQLDTAITIAAGQARIGTVVARGDGADLAISGNLELADNNLDARVTLTSSSVNDPNAGRPEIAIMLRGPVAAPKRNIDVAVLSGWLALRAVEQQARKLEEAERQAAIRAREEAERIRRDEAERVVREEAAARAREEAAVRAREETRAREEARIRAEAARAREAATQPLTMPPIPHLQQPMPLMPPIVLPAAEGATNALPDVRERAPALPPPIDIRPAAGDGLPTARPRAPAPARQPTGALPLGMQPVSEIFPGMQR